MCEYCTMEQLFTVAVNAICVAIDLPMLIMNLGACSQSISGLLWRKITLRLSKQFKATDKAER